MMIHSLAKAVQHGSRQIPAQRAGQAANQALNVVSLGVKEARAIRQPAIKRYFHGDAEDKIRVMLASRKPQEMNTEGDRYGMGQIAPPGQHPLTHDYWAAEVAVVNKITDTRFDKAMKLVSEFDLNDIRSSSDKARFVADRLDRYLPESKNEAIDDLRDLESVLLEPMAETGVFRGDVQNTTSVTFAVYTKLSEHRMSFRDLKDLVNAIQTLRNQLGDDAILVEHTVSQKALWPNIGYDQEMEFATFEKALAVCSDLCHEQKSSFDQQWVKAFQEALKLMRHPSSTAI